MSSSFQLPDFTITSSIATTPVDIQTAYKEYIPAPVEAYVLNHTNELGYSSTQNPPGCNVLGDTSKVPYQEELQNYLRELDAYSDLVANFEGIEDLRNLKRKLLNDNKNSNEVCQSLELHPEGLPALFPSKQLSYTRSGYVEPLLPPMRSLKICESRKYLMNMDYMVHDFAEMCHRIPPWAKTVFIDMGASLDFHGGMGSPAMYITKLYSKFGINFDHIYAFEITAKKAVDVYNRVPEELMASYHWINVGVSADPDSKYNPLVSLLRKLNREDFVVVKLDIDTSFIEVPLVHQILNQENLFGLIDQFYFEHHVHLGELARNWGGTMNGTIEDSLRLFSGLREKGVAAHFWP